MVGCPKQRHAFMRLLKCARCGCTMTAEKKKGKYEYYRCTGFKGARGNEYIREERLSALLGEVVKPIQITRQIADDIATALRATDHEAEQRSCESLRKLDHRRRTNSASWIVATKILFQVGFQKSSGRGNRRSGKASSRRWMLKRLRLEQPRPLSTTTAQRILELAKRAEFIYKSQDPTEQRRSLETVLSNCTFDRGTLSPTDSKPFDLIVRGNETGDWRGVWDEFRNWLNRAR
jgi:site-specific DNA recombinase